MKGTSDIMDAAIVKIISKMQPSVIFDYGCGDTELTWKVAALGHKVTGFDVSDDAILRQRSKRMTPTVEFLTAAQYSKAKGALRSKYDVVLCSLVLCVIEDIDEVEEVVGNIRDLLHDGGLAIIGFCNPLYMKCCESEIQVKMVPPGKAYSDCFGYDKTVKSTGRSRRDYHRPIRTYEDLFEKAGFQVLDVAQTEGVTPDSKRVSDFIIYTMKKGERP